MDGCSSENYKNYDGGSDIRCCHKDKTSLEERDDMTGMGDGATGISDVSHPDENSESEQVMSRQQIEEALAGVMDDMERKRKHDLKILADVKEEIVAQAQKSCELLEQYMSSTHQALGKELDERVQALLRVLDQIKQSEEELQQSRSALNRLCSDIRTHPL